jgi:hypothetical protein
MMAERYIEIIKTLQALIHEEFMNARQVVSKKGDFDFVSGTVIAELQSHDILYQRIDHLIKGFKNSSPLFDDLKFKHAFLDLQYFQLIAIESDLERTIMAIQEFVDTAKQNSHAIDFDAPVFPRHNDVRKFLQLSKEIAMRSNAQRVLLDTPPLTELQAASCLNLYTMTSERIVLQWFLANMPFGTPSAFLKEYENQSTNINISSIELF